MLKTEQVYKQSIWNRNISMFVGLAILLLIVIISTTVGDTIFNDARINIFKTMFVSIILEALPFILIGVFISSIVHVFVPEQTIKRMIPKNLVLGILVASLLGIIFPICECGMVPVIRRLIKKGMPLYVATTFILVGPILNPIVFLSTFTAFRNRPEITYSRMGLALLVALVIGIFIYRFIKSNQLKEQSHDDHHHNHDHDHSHGNKWIDLMGHITSEFFEMGKYLMFGSILAAGLQTVIDRESLVSIGNGPILANVLMMGLAFVLSLCSTSDAFVASSFSTTFSSGSLIAFLVFGPMINLKGILMMLAVFKNRFVVWLTALVFLTVLCGSLIIEWLLLR